MYIHCSYTLLPYISKADKQELRRKEKKGHLVCVKFRKINNTCIIHVKRKHLGILVYIIYKTDDDVYMYTCIYMYWCIHTR